MVRSDKDALAARERRERMRANRDKNGVSLNPNCTHGNYNGYSYYKCRCAECRRANAENKALNIARRKHNLLIMGGLKADAGN